MSEQPSAPSPEQPAASNGSASRNGVHGLRAVISDIHGNIEAFVAVLKDIEQQKVDEIVCLGDVVGYGPNPVECLKLVRKVARWSLCGNHDAAMFMTHAVGFNEMAARAAAWQRSFMRPGLFSLPGKVARWRWLENLPAMRQEGDAMYVHASPRDPLMEYVLEEDFQDMGFGPSQKVVEMFEKFDWVCFVGHSHRPGIANHEYKWIKPAELKDLTYDLPSGEKTIVNIGAVGQPRDHNPDACYVLFDGHRVRYRRVKYDVETTQKKIRAVPELADRLADRLGKGL
ncbi:MAG: phosphoesterase [Planctomycetota bacterium]